MKTVARILPGLTVACLALFTQPTQAKSLVEQLFPRETSCYQRQYSRDHLERHRDQQVTTIALGPSGLDARRNLGVEVAVTLRGSREVYLAYASCEARGRVLACAMEGDAGAFTLEAARDRAILLTVSRQGMGFEGSRRFIELSGTTGDDRSFLLPAGNARSCP